GMVASWEAGERPEIVFWAETMYPYSMLAPGAQGVVRRPRRYGDRDYEIPVDLEREIQERALGEIARWIRTGGFFVTGSHLWEGVPADAGPGAYSVHTSEMVAFDREKRMVAHRPKSRLVPFGEFLPLASWLPDSREIARLIFRNVGLLPDLTERPPEGPLRLTLPGEDELLLGSAVCWENPFESIFRAQALQGAEAFCVLSNEGWFGLGAEMDQMAAATRYRAAETGRAILRVTNTGLTLWVDAHGEIREALPRGEPGWLAVFLPRTPRGYRSVYLLGGWLFLRALAALAGLLVLLSWLPGRLFRAP
ncbi:MAG: nitrilase-related carbon-nitrogen hydrolase, partial [Planctomycetota bacterium]